jgi:hypothetical protein
MGNQPRLCIANTWSAVGSAPANEVIDVRCYNKTGKPTNSPFIVNWLSLSDSSGHLAYGSDFSPTSGCGSGQASFAFDPLGGPIMTCFTYPSGLPTTVEYRIPHLGVTGGVAQVMALAQRGDQAGASAGFCDLVNFRSVEFNLYDPDEYVDSICYAFNTSGTPFQQDYRLSTDWFMQGVGMVGIGGAHAAYLVANRATTASYSPTASSSYSTGGAITVTRAGTGSYSVLLKGQPAGGSAQVTAIAGANARYCVVRSVSTVAPQRIGVLCFNAAGVPTDTAFTLSYAK